MSYLGKEIRLNRLLNQKSGKLLAIAVDHSISRGIYDGLIPIRETLRRIVDGCPDSITMHKGIAQTCFEPFAGKNQVSLVLKASSFAPYHFNYDTQTATVEEAVRLGADAISMGVIVGGDSQAEQLAQLARLTRKAEEYGMPVIAHIYARGEQILKEEQRNWKNVAYAVRAGAELGVDIVKTTYTGDVESFARVVETCPTRVAVAGGDRCKTPREFLQMTRDVMDAGGAGVTYGRFVWSYPDPAAMIRALGKVIHEGSGVDDALSML